MKGISTACINCDGFEKDHHKDLGHLWCPKWAKNRNHAGRFGLTYAPLSGKLS